jgi:CHRD domain
MKAFTVLSVVLGVVAISCGSSGSSSAPTTPSGPSTTTFTTSLSPANEVPPVTNGESTITGTAMITVHATRDSAGNVTAATADFQVNASGFPAGAALVMAHVHPGAAGAVGGVLLATGITPGAVAITNGSASFTQNGVNVPPDQAQAILGNPAGYYFNIHTSLNVGGAARGQLAPGASNGNPPPPTTCPTPGYC